MGCYGFVGTWLANRKEKRRKRNGELCEQDPRFLKMSNLDKQKAFEATIDRHQEMLGNKIKFARECNRKVEDCKAVRSDSVLSRKANNGRMDDVVGEKECQDGATTPSEYVLPVPFWNDKNGNHPGLGMSTRPDTYLVVVSITTVGQQLDTEGYHVT